MAFAKDLHIEAIATKYAYQLGDIARPNEVRENHCPATPASNPTSSPNIFYGYASILKKGDAAFIRRSDKTWRFAIVVDRVRGREPHIDFVVDKEGSVKRIVPKYWSTFIRGINSSSSDKRLKAKSKDLTNEMQKIDKKKSHDDYQESKADFQEENSKEPREEIVVTKHNTHRKTSTFGHRFVAPELFCEKEIIISSSKETRQEDQNAATAVILYASLESKPEPSRSEAAAHKSGRPKTNNHNRSSRVDEDPSSSSSKINSQRKHSKSRTSVAPEEEAEEVKAKDDNLPLHPIPLPQPALARSASTNERSSSSKQAAVDPSSLRRTKSGTTTTASTSKNSTACFDQVDNVQTLFEQVMIGYGKQITRKKKGYVARAA